MFSPFSLIKTSPWDCSCGWVCAEKAWLTYSSFSYQHCLGGTFSVHPKRPCHGWVTSKNRPLWHLAWIQMEGQMQEFLFLLIYFFLNNVRLRWGGFRKGTNSEKVWWIKNLLSGGLCSTEGHSSYYQSRAEGVFWLKVSAAIVIFNKTVMLCSWHVGWRVVMQKMFMACKRPVNNSFSDWRVTEWVVVHTVHWQNILLS